MPEEFIWKLLAGNVRDNLDPFSEYDEATLNGALRAAGLHSLPESHFTYLDNVSITSDTKSSTSSHTKVALDFQVTLDTKVEAGGANFSLGQRYVIHWIIIDIIFIPLPTDRSSLLLVQLFIKARFCFSTKVRTVVCDLRIDYWNLYVIH